MKSELEMKYESMRFLKEQIGRARSSEMTEDMQMKVREQANTMANCQKELQKLTIERDHLKLQMARNQEDVKEFTVPPGDADPKMDIIKRDNRELKAQIIGLKAQLRRQENASKETLNKMYELKDEEKRGIRSKTSRKISSSLREIRSTSLSEIAQLQQEIETLKTKKKDVEKDLVSDKIIK